MLAQFVAAMHRDHPGGEVEVLDALQPRALQHRAQRLLIRVEANRLREVAVGVGVAGGRSRGGGGLGGGVFGQLKSVNGNTLTVTTQNGDETVDLTANTQIEKTTAGTTADLKAGEQLVVRGQRDSSGTVTAESVQITTGGAPRSTPTP